MSRCMQFSNGKTAKRTENVVGNLSMSADLMFNSLGTSFDIGDSKFW